MNGRAYEPELGRFVSADPLVPGPGMSQAFNRFSYVLNGPLSLRDPSGFAPTGASLQTTRYVWDGGGAMPGQMAREKQSLDLFPFNYMIRVHNGFSFDPSKTVLPEVSVGCNAYCALMRRTYTHAMSIHALEFLRGQQRDRGWPPIFGRCVTSDIAMLCRLLSF